VVSGATDWLARHDTRGLTAVAIAPDLGERYLDTIYQTNWLQDLYGEQILDAEQLNTAPPREKPAPREPERRPRS
jgi:cysteine synthase A